MPVVSRKSHVPSLRESDMPVVNRKMRNYERYPEIRKIYTKRDSNVTGLYLNKTLNEGDFTTNEISRFFLNLK